MENLEIKREALAILISLDNVDDFTKNIAKIYVDNNVYGGVDSIMFYLWSQHKALAKHLLNVYNSNIENPVIKESLVDEYTAIEELIWCIYTDNECSYSLSNASKWLESSRMLKDFEANGYKVSVSMTGVYLVHGHLFKILSEAHNYFFPNN